MDLLTLRYAKEIHCLYVFWGMSLAVAAFTFAILTQAKGLYPFITPILGGSILIGIITHTLRFRENWR